MNEDRSSVVDMVRNHEEFNEIGLPPNLAGTYVFTHRKTGKKYVGSSHDLRWRLRRNKTLLRNGCHSNRDFQTAYDEDPRFHVSVTITESRDEAYDHEQKFLDDFIKTGLLFNRQANARHAEIGTKPTRETIEKIKSKVVGLKRSGETREKIRQSKLGVPRSEAMREFLRQRQLGKKASEETRRKQSEIRKGKPLSRPRTPEHMAKIVAAKAGFRHSAESILRIRENSATAKPVVAAGVKYPSASEASRILGIDHKTIRTRIADSRPQFKDWHYG